MTSAWAAVTVPAGALSAADRRALEPSLYREGRPGWFASDSATQPLAVCILGSDADNVV
jgi:hypothetical protein